MGIKKHNLPGTERTNIHSLILKIWRRDGGSSGAQPTWHGQITHVPSGERGYSNDPNELLTNIAVHLRNIGVRLTMYWRVGLWLHALKRRSKQDAP